MFPNAAELFRVRSLGSNRPVALVKSTNVHRDTRLRVTCQMRYLFAAVALAGALMTGCVGSDSEVAPPSDPESQPFRGVSCSGTRCGWCAKYRFEGHLPVSLI